jgi:hypothetical protein
MASRQHSEKEQKARGALPSELRPIFDDFVADYKYAAVLRHGKPYVSYIVLADMVRAGWRRAAEPTPEKGQYEGEARRGD